MHLDPFKPALKAPGTKRLKLAHKKLLSNFALNFNLRRYYLGSAGAAGEAAAAEQNLYEVRLAVESFAAELAMVGRCRLTLSNSR